MIAAGKKAKVLSPFGGTVSAVNRDVIESPNLPWRDSYRRGWLLMVKPDHPEEISQLYSGEAAKTWFTKQALNLSTFLMKWGPKSYKKEEAQDGQLIQRIIRNQWDKLTEILLKNNNDKLEVRNPNFETITNDRNRNFKTKNRKSKKV